MPAKPAKAPSAPKQLKFSPQLFDFLSELKANNNKEWFEANRSRYLESVREPFLAFITAFRPRLQSISPLLIADPKPFGGSMLRIHRDLRFSKSKEPYKPMAAASFYHQSSKESAPGIYLHLDADYCFLGLGLWHPDTITRTKVTDAIVAKPEAWRDAISSRAFRASFKSAGKLAGESLKKLPKRYNPQHPFADDLKRKDFIVVANFTQKQVCAKDFIERVDGICRTASPFLKFLTQAVGLRW